jgi:hypothetical protein
VSLPLPRRTKPPCAFGIWLNLYQESPFDTTKFLTVVVGTARSAARVIAFDGAPLPPRGLAADDPTSR